MEAAGYFEPLKLFISLEELLRVECIQTFDELLEFCRCEEKVDIVILMQQLLFNVHLDQYSSTGVEIVDFWRALELLRLQHAFVPNGVLIYNKLYFQNPSDQAQDWISQEMVKPHVRMMKEKLKFTDVQIINGLRILRERDEEITFICLLNTLVPTENAVLNVYVGMGKYAFSADIRLVLRNCYDIYHGEPTQEQFELEWNRIKGTGIEHLMEQVEIEKTRADRTETEALNREAVLQEEMRRAETEALNREAEKRRAEEEKRRAEEEKQEALNRETKLQKEKRRAEEEKRRAEEEKRRAEEEKQEALNRETKLQKEKKRVEKEKLQAMRDFNDAIEVRNEAIDEIIQVLNREEVLKKEKEAEWEKAEAERVKAEAERFRAEMLEKELAKMTALFEKEKKQLLLQMQQMAGLVRA
ncbi:Microtubule-associated protein 1A [Mizuhopecten yessoensis]|uniref:Microtubule-associated protein 1A n=1 Tax=Mizuhopecten yessoensis TaxID=6573 RepID=A0A210PMR3_MIZYE|nr:Microtubule-associated protein 1A [Mizuhopecten yessoensis]